MMKLIGVDLPIKNATSRATFKNVFKAETVHDDKDISS